MNKYHGNLREPSFKGPKPKRDEKSKQPSTGGYKKGKKTGNKEKY